MRRPIGFAVVARCQVRGDKYAPGSLFLHRETFDTTPLRALFFDANPHGGRASSRASNCEGDSPSRGRAIAAVVRGRRAPNRRLASRGLIHGLSLGTHGSGPVARGGAAPRDFTRRLRKRPLFESGAEGGRVGMAGERGRRVAWASRAEGGKQ